MDEMSGQFPPLPAGTFNRGRESELSGKLVFAAHLVCLMT
jgi:hypothetical protein